MIPRAAITEWSRLAPWPAVDQVEQDLVLSRLIVELAGDPLLGEELVFRGGTCLHKVVLPARPHHQVPYQVESAWCSGSADVLTFQPEESVATKLRALFQRRKGRDLFDLLVALTVLGLDPAEIVACFDPYRRDGYPGERARQGLEEHLGDSGFRADLVPLLREVPEGYDLATAG